MKSRINSIIVIVPKRFEGITEVILTNFEGWCREESLPIVPEVQFCLNPFEVTDIPTSIEGSRVLFSPDIIKLGIIRTEVVGRIVNTLKLFLANNEPDYKVLLECENSNSVSKEAQETLQSFSIILKGLSLQDQSWVFRRLYKNLIKFRQERINFLAKELDVVQHEELELHSALINTKINGQG